jgi:hypothetical protein
VLRSQIEVLQVGHLSKVQTPSSSPQSGMASSPAAYFNLLVLNVPVPGATFEDIGLADSPPTG